MLKDVLKLALLSLFKDVFKLALTAFVTGLFAALATTLYGLFISQVSIDQTASQRAQMINLLQEISQKLGESGSVGTDISTRSIAPYNEMAATEPVDIDKLNLNYDNPQNYARLFGFGPRLYKTSIYVTGLEEANLIAQDIVKVHWNFKNASETTLKSQSLFLSKITKSFDITAEVWLDKKIVQSENIKNPVLLKTTIKI